MAGAIGGTPDSLFHRMRASVPLTAFIKNQVTLCGVRGSHSACKPPLTTVPSHSMATQRRSMLLVSFPWLSVLYTTVGGVRVVADGRWGAGRDEDTLQFSTMSAVPTPATPRTAAITALTEKVQALEEEVMWLARASNCSTAISRMTTAGSRILKKHFNLHEASDNHAPLLGLHRAVDRGYVSVLAPASVRTAAGVGMEWQASERASSAAYKQCLEEILGHIAPNFEALLVHDEQKTLDTSTRTLPFALHGTTDVIIRPRRVFGHKVVAALARTVAQPKHHLTDMRLVIQLKRDVDSNYARYVNQSIAELFAADLRADGPVIAVLTDLADKWTFLWLTRQGNQQTLQNVRLRTKQSGIQALQSVLSFDPTTLGQTHRLCKVHNLATEALL